MAELPHNIYEQQQANKRKTIVVMAMFIAFVGLLGVGFDVFVLGFLSQGHMIIPFGTMIALAAGFGSGYWSLQSGAQAVLSSSKAQPVPEDDPHFQQLRNIVDEMAISSGLPRPKLFVIPDPDPNAFATGKDPDHACIAVTEGLLERLNREELQAVIAHEMGHVRNYDIRLMTVIAALIGTVMLLSEFGLRSWSFGGGRRKSDRGSGAGGAVVFVLWLFAMILAPFVAQILALAISRQREYLADASGAEMTRNPLALASALEKIDGANDPTRSIKKGTAHLCIADPLGRQVNVHDGVVAGLFATHPPITKRIALLKAMAYQPA